MLIIVAALALSAGPALPSRPVAGTYVAHFAYDRMAKDALPVRLAADGLYSGGNKIGEWHMSRNGKSLVIDFVSNGLRHSGCYTPLGPSSWRGMVAIFNENVDPRRLVSVHSLSLVLEKKK